MNFEEYEKIMLIFARDFYTCQNCGKQPGIEGLQRAHRIKQGSGSEKHIKEYCLTKYQKNYSLKFIRENIIDNPLNIVTVCCLRCNSAYNIFNKPILMNNLIDKILKSIGEI